MAAAREARKSTGGGFFEFRCDTVLEGLSGVKQVAQGVHKGFRCWGSGVRGTGFPLQGWLWTAECGVWVKSSARNSEAKPV